jgi:predicted dehydrogenase
VLCHTDTLVHPIADEDNAIALIRFESGAVGQFEVSWTFRGGMDLRDEVAGTHGTIWLNHFLRTGFEMFTPAAACGYVAEKAETSAGWLFPVGDEGVRARLRGHVQRHVRRRSTAGQSRRRRSTTATVVNAIMDACYASARAGPGHRSSWSGARDDAADRGERPSDTRARS